MAVTTTVYVVCSPLDRVGKTLIARLLSEFLMTENRYLDAFDLGSNRPSLADYLPDCTIPADISTTQGQMRLFDRLIAEDAVPKVVDLGHTAFEPFFRVVGQVGFVVEARRCNIQLVVLFLANPGPVSMRAYAALQRSLTGMVVVPVHNEGLVRNLDRNQFPITGGASLPLRIPALATGLQRVIADPKFSFADFWRGEDCRVSESYRHELESWMKRSFLEFRELELRLLLESLKLSLQA
jgi:hypothetical protein